jgi:TPR repeat protein
MWFFIVLLLVAGFIVWKRVANIRNRSGETGMYSGIIKEKDFKGELHVSEWGLAWALSIIQAYMRENGAVAHEILKDHPYFFVSYSIAEDELELFFYGTLYRDITWRPRDYHYQESTSEFLQDVELDFSHDKEKQERFRSSAESLFRQACEQYMKNDLPGRAAWVFSRLGNLGVREAQYNYSVALRTGRGVRKDIRESVNWLQNADEVNELPIAMQNLGIHYFNGDGVERDRALGIQWVQKAADAGFLHAVNVLEKMNKTPE